MTNTSNLRVAIVGAGLAGGAAALHLARIPGVDITVYERSDEPRQTGAWIGVTRTGQRIVEEICGKGVLEGISHHRTTRALVKDRLGNLVRDSSHEEDERRWSSATVRQDLHRILIERIPKSKILGGKRVKGYRSYPDRVVVDFWDATSAECDLLVVADGINSRIRRQMRPNDKVTFTGALEYMKVYDRATLEKLVPNLPTQFTMWADVGGRALVWMGDVGCGRFSLIIVVPEPKDKGNSLKWAEEAGKDRVNHLIDFFKDWDPLINNILHQTGDILLFPICRGTFLEHLTDGERTVFIGDAAHPTGGAYGAGSSFALADGKALGMAIEYISQRHQIKDRLSIQKILYLYDETRRHFCQKVFEQLAREMSGGEEEDTTWLAAHDPQDEFPDAVARLQALEAKQVLWSLKAMIEADRVANRQKTERLAQIFATRGDHLISSPV